MANRSRAILSFEDLAFIEKYVETLNPEASYKHAHPTYKGPNARQLGYHTIRRYAVQAAIEVRRSQIAAEMNVTPAEVIRRIMLLGYSDLAELAGQDGNYLSVKDLPESVRLAIQSVKVLRTTVQSNEGGITITDQVLLYTLHNKQAALDSLWDKLFKGLRGGDKGKTDEQLEREIKANEEALEAITAARARADKLRKTVAKTSQAALAEAGQPEGPKKGNGTKKGNGKGNGGIR